MEAPTRLNCVDLLLFQRLWISDRFESFGGRRYIVSIGQGRTEDDFTQEENGNSFATLNLIDKLKHISILASQARQATMGGQIEAEEVDAKWPKIVSFLPLF